MMKSNSCIDAERMPPDEATLAPQGIARHRVFPSRPVNISTGDPPYALKTGESARLVLIDVLGLVQRVGGLRMAADNGKPVGDLTLRTLAMPADANAAGDIFGGWVMAQMDLACGIRAAERAKGRVVTAAVKEMSFAKPMKVGDTLGIYISIARIGRTSMTLQVEAWAQRYLSDVMERVTHADFIMVALDVDGKPKAIPAE
jgi:acyl-CoA thioesterase YciA